MTHATASSIDTRRTAKRTATAVGLLVGSLVLGIVVAIGGFIAADLLGALTETRKTILEMLASELGYLLAGLAFLAFASDGSFISWRRPTASELRLVVLGIGAVTAVEGLRQVGVGLGMLERAGSVSVSGDLGLVATLAIVALLVLVAPLMEELFFRGVLQRYVGNVSSPTVGIAVATALFVPMHVLGIMGTTSSLPAVLAGLLVVGVLSVVVGWAYARTDRLLVPIAIHAGYNTLAIGIGVLVIEFL